MSLLTNVQATLLDVQAELIAFRSEARDKPATPSKPRESFSVEVAAKLIGKSDYTVRKWCNLGRINASKRSERRGGTALWGITADEITRYKDEGLLPIDVSRNVDR